MCRAYVFIQYLHVCQERNSWYLLHTVKAPISYEPFPTFLHVCVSFLRYLIMRKKERNKHWILTGCHPPLLLFSEGSRLPNPWACLTIPLLPCRTPTLLFWSQGILEEKSLLTSNCYHLGLLLSFLKKKKQKKTNNKPTCQSAACVAPRWIISHVCSDEVGEECRDTVAQYGAGVQMLACTLMLIAHHWKDFIRQCGFC